MTDENEIEEEGELPAAPPTEAVAGTFGWILKKLMPMLVALILLSATIWSISIFGLTIYRDYLKVPDEVQVPDVTNMEIKEAYEAIESVGLRLQVHENRYDKVVKKRIVLDQNPEGGKMVREGRTILVVVSLGPELMSVPKLTGESLRTAKISLSNAKLRGQKGLPTKAGIHRHDQIAIYHVDQILRRIDRGMRIEGDSRSGSPVADLTEQAMEMHRRLPVNGNLPNSQIEQPAQIILRVGDHQMDVHRQVGKLSNQLLNDGKSEAQIWHEMPVHEVEVQDVGPRLDTSRDLLAHTVEVAGQK